MKTFVIAAFAGLLGSMALPAKACGVALALTVDVSGSVDEREFELQMGGLAAALRDGLVADALVDQKAALSVVQWSGKSRQQVSVPWTRVSSPADVARLADRVETAGRAWRNFSTAIGEALTFTANLFGEVSDCKRKVIDVSGDGKSNEGAPPEDLRIALASAGFQINALAIETDEKALAEYFRDHVIAGEAAFVITATGFDDYPEKIRRKLIREVTKQIAAR